MSGSEVSEVSEPELKKQKSDVEEIKDQISEGVEAKKSDEEETNEQMSEVVETKKPDEETEEQKAAIKKKKSEGRKLMYDSDDYSDDEERDRDYDEYCRELEESDGFAVKNYPKMTLPGKTIPINFRNPIYRKHSELAIDLFNKENASSYKLKEVTNIAAYLVQGPIYNLSFTASEGDDESDVKCFRGSVWEDWGNHGNLSALKCYLHEQK